MSMDVSVIIVNYNTEQLLNQCIQSILDNTKGICYEIIVVDNASTDNSVSAVKRLYPDVKVIQNEVNSGFGAANNLGIRKSSGEYIFLLNSDTYLLHNSIKVFFDFMTNPINSNVGVCGGELLNEDGKKAISYGNFPTIKEVFFSLGFSYVFKRFFDRHIASAVVNYTEVSKEVDFISGADMFIRRSTLDVTGLFDTEFFLYCEEAELSFRIKENGYKSVILPSSKIIHLEGGSQTINSEQNFAKFKIVMKSRILFFKKCYGFFSALIVKALYILRAILEGFVRLQLGVGIKKAFIIMAA